MIKLGKKAGEFIINDFAKSMNGIKFGENKIVPLFTTAKFADKKAVLITFVELKKPILDEGESIKTVYKKDIKRPLVTMVFDSTESVKTVKSWFGFLLSVAPLHFYSEKEM